MSFKKGDRIRVISKGYTGTVYGQDEDGVWIELDAPALCHDGNDPDSEPFLSSLAVVPEHMLELIETSNPDWESMWESAVKKDDK